MTEHKHYGEPFAKNNGSDATAHANAMVADFYKGDMVGAAKEDIRGLVATIKFKAGPLVESAIGDVEALTSPTANKNKVTKSR